MNKRIKKKKEKQRIAEASEAISLLCAITPQVAQACFDAISSALDKMVSILRSIDWEEVAKRVSENGGEE